MREIKFRRVFDKGVVGYEKFQEAQWLYSPDGIYWRHGHPKWAASTLNQYTGLRDKNGVEIYEGDIVDVKWNGRGTIEYLGACFYARVKNDIPILENDGQRMEVLGNIYNNPELLK